METSTSLELAHREILWNVSSLPNVVTMYLLFGVSLIVCGWGFWRRFVLWTDGTPAPERLGEGRKRFLLLWHWVMKQKGVLRERKPGIFHTFILWGFLVLLFATTMVFIDHDLGLNIYRGRFYLAVTVLADVFGLLLLIGIALAYYRRYVEQPDRLHSGAGDSLMLTLLAAMCVQGFLLEALRIHATADQWAAYSPVGYALSLLFWDFSEDSARLLHFGIWWFHAATVFMFIGLLPYTKFLHIFSSSANLFFRDISRPKGALSYPGDIDNLMEEMLSSEEEEEFVIGTPTLEALSWKGRLDLDACTSCGRCQSVCPAYNSGKALSPKWLILDSREHMLRLHADGKLRDSQESNPLFSKLNSLDSSLIKEVLLDNPENGMHRADNPLVQQAALDLGSEPGARLAGEVLNEDVFWSCTTCGACMEVCPVGIEHVDYIVDVRRSMALMEGNIPSEAQSSLRAIETRGNPFGPAEDRCNWSEGLEVNILEEGDSVDVLYWVGCISAYDKRKQSIARSMVEILNRSGLSWGILGNKEQCTGDPARRLGEENLFQSSAKANLATLSTVSFSRIVANCPHCFNTLKNEYPALGALQERGEVQVVHHSHFIKELLDTGKLTVEENTSRDITFHDPCYLGRHNDTYEEPRDVLVKIGGKPVTEMKDSRERGMCCGAGGGHYLFDMKVGERINAQRAEQAASTGASTVATGCPFCLQMMEDGIKLNGDEERLEVRDIAELVAESLVSERI